MSTIININGNRQYEAADCTMTLLGYQEDEVKEISYSYDRKHNHNESLKGITSWSMGGISNLKCTVTLYMTAVQRILKAAKAAGTNDITLIKPFPVAYTYANDELVEVNDLVSMKFQSFGRTVTGEGGLAQQFEMFVTAIEPDK